MNIPSDQVAYKKKVGQIGTDPVYELGLRGGLHIVAVARKGKAETLGVGPHRAVARHIAMKREPTLQITELNKSDHIEPEFFADMLPKYEADTQRFRALQGFGD